MRDERQEYCNLWCFSSKNCHKLLRDYQRTMLGYRLRSYREHTARLYGADLAILKRLKKEMRLYEPEPVT